MNYEAAELCVFGHYSKTSDVPRGGKNAICMDFAVGERFRQRLEPGFNGRFERHFLAALSIPEMIITFDDGQTRRVSMAP